jgi:hypothetical protein
VPGLRGVRSQDRVYRIARAPDPWAWPDWADVGSDGTFGNRWDDSESSYRVLYASSSKLGAFVEVLARFRPDPHVLAGLGEIKGEGWGASGAGQLPRSWIEGRRIGTANLAGAYADVGHSDSLAVLRTAMASRLVHHKLTDLDASAVRLAAPRRFTQEISRYVYERTEPSGHRSFAGIAYRSRLGDDFQNWAIFEPVAHGEGVLHDLDVSRIRSDDPDLSQALSILGVALV